MRAEKIRNHSELMTKAICWGDCTKKSEIKGEVTSYLYYLAGNSEADNIG